MPLIKNVLKPLGKSILIPLELTTVAATTDVAVHQEMFGSGHPLDLAPRKTTLIISNEEMDDIMKIVKSLEKSGLFIEGISEAIKNEAKKQKRGFLSMLLGILVASLLGNLSTDKDTINADEGTIKAG